MKYLLLTLALSISIIGNVEAKQYLSRKNKTKPTPTFSAKSYLIADTDGIILKEYNINDVRPIASISKLLLGLLSSEQELDEQLEIPTARNVQTVIPKTIKSLTRRELLTLAMVKSDNLSAQVLCLNLNNCVERMNLKAKEIGMDNTHFVEPTGLSRENTSTAGDLLKLLLVASKSLLLSHISSLSEAEIDADKTPIKVKNTNPLTFKFDTLMSKTGYTKPAGGCLVMILNSSSGRKFFILLGSRNSKTRIPDMEKLVRDSYAY